MGSAVAHSTGVHVTAFCEGAVPVLIPLVAGGAGTSWRGGGAWPALSGWWGLYKEHGAGCPAGSSGVRGLRPSLRERPAHKKPS